MPVFSFSGETSIAEYSSTLKIYYDVFLASCKSYFLKRLV